MLGFGHKRYINSADIEFREIEINFSLTLQLPSQQEHAVLYWNVSLQKLQLK
jgi:hypothetical protein